MTAPVVIVTSEAIDPRRAFLLIAAAHHDQVQRGEESLDYAFLSVTGWFDHMFPAEEPCCPTCGCVPCINPTFCAECCRADERRRKT
jgi:hypothetical protein